MTDVRFPSTGNTRLWWIAANGLALPGAPTVAEINAGLDISDAVSWNDKDLGVQASNTTDDPAITAKGKTTARGSAQYGGGLSFYYPRSATDTTNKYKTVRDIMKVPRTIGFIVERVDGRELLTTSGTAANPGTEIAAGDIVNVYKVQTASYGEVVTGDDAYRYTVTMLPKGQVFTRAVVRANATPVAPVIVGTGGSGAVGTKVALEGTLIGRKYTRGLVWASSDATKVTVDSHGVFVRVATGTANITATDPATNTPSTPLAVTVA